ncbi:response regulator [Vreelandella neptunia]|uniref:Response regulator transcription factor n=1 Tax=Vreelandella neptunia TaxID=115551 RepID=A0ABS9S951_9GAMM|nr:response regulator transcription factor [Halomonas neptunia]MCH4812640.1 response regulator transcription factor [Halomonas neptunia]
MNPQGNSEPSIRVVIINESGFIREGLCRVIEGFKDIEVVASLCSPHALAEVTQYLPVDVVLIDAQPPSQAGFEAAKQLCKSGGKTRVVILSVNPSLAEVKRALQVGANGFLLREAGVSELEVALHAAVKGKIFLCPTILKRLSVALAVDELPTSGSMPFNAAQDLYSIDEIIGKALRLGILRQEQ